MFYINKIPILANELDILNELKHQLKIRGIERFAEFKKGSKNIQFNCPIHKDGQERKPSCGITITNQENVPAGTVHCLACGYVATLEEMISHCFGYDDNGEYGKKWLINNFVTAKINERKDLTLNYSRQKNKENQEYIKESELQKYRYYHDYMYKRKLTNEIIEKFDVGYDDNFILKDKFGQVKGRLKCLTFPVRDETGKTLFIARRSVDIKFFHYPENVDKPIYGIYELSGKESEIIICEGIIDALTCWVYGKPAIALLGLGTQKQYRQLLQMQCRKFIIALDPDTAGQKAAEKLKRILGKNKIITTYEIPIGKDINDLNQYEFNNLLELF